MLKWKVISAKNAIAWILFLLPLFLAKAAFAQEPYLGEIRMFSGVYCPERWMDADGRSLEVVRFQALYSLFGTTYGGDGRVSFRLPDLRGRVAIGMGQGPGLTPYQQGATGGTESVTLSASRDASP